MFFSHQKKCFSLKSHLVRLLCQARGTKDLHQVVVLKHTHLRSHRVPVPKNPDPPSVRKVTRNRVIEVIKNLALGIPVALIRKARVHFLRKRRTSFLKTKLSNTFIDQQKTWTNMMVRIFPSEGDAYPVFRSCAWVLPGSFSGTGPHCAHPWSCGVWPLGRWGKYLAEKSLRGTWAVTVSWIPTLDILSMVFSCTIQQVKKNTLKVHYIYK